MALVNTTLGAACALGDKQITVASATGLLAGLLGKIGGEWVQITKGYTIASTTVPVLRGQEGTAQVAHSNGAQVTFFGLASDLTAESPGTVSPTPAAGRARETTEINATAAWLPKGGDQDELVILNGTSVIALTIVNPTQDQTGKVVTFVGNGKAAHTITYTTTGFGNVGANADLVTFGANQANSFQMIACGGFWVILGGFGTATINVTGPTVA